MLVDYRLEVPIVFQIMKYILNSY